MEHNFNLFDNNLSGGVPTELGLLSAMTGFFQLCCNDFTQALPSQLGGLTALRVRLGSCCVCVMLIFEFLMTDLFFCTSVSVCGWMHDGEPAV